MMIGGKAPSAYAQSADLKGRRELLRLQELLRCKVNNRFSSLDVI